MHSLWNAHKVNGIRVAFVATIIVDLTFDSYFCIRSSPLLESLKYIFLFCTFKLCNSFTSEYISWKNYVIFLRRQLQLLVWEIINLKKVNCTGKPRNIIWVSRPPTKVKISSRLIGLSSLAASYYYHHNLRVKKREERSCDNKRCGYKLASGAK